MNRSAILRKAHDHSEHIIAAAIFVSAAALYLRTAGPTLGGAHDSAEFQHIAYTLGIAHPTGYPLYLIIGKLFTTLVPIGNIAYRMNVLSVLLAAASSVLIYFVALQLTGRRVASLFAAATFTTNSLIWRHAGVASVGPLHNLLLAGTLLALLQWYVRRKQGEPTNALLVAAFLFGLGLAHHRSTLLLAPSIAVFVFLTDPGLLRRPSEWVRSGICLALPLLLYLYLPIFANGSPWYSNTLEGFVNQVSAGEIGNYLRTTMDELVQGNLQIAQYLSDSLGYVGLTLVIVGAASTAPRWNQWTTLLRGTAVALFLGLGTLSFSGFAAVCECEHDRYFTLPFFFLLLWFGIGIGAVEMFLEHRVSSNSARRVAQTVLIAVLAAGVILPFGDRFREADWSAYDREYKLWDEVFSLPIPPGSVLVGEWRQLNGMRYMQRVERRRPDLQFVGTFYDPSPQTEAAENAFADGRAIFLAPGIALPKGSYRYTLLGPLLQVRDRPQRQPPESGQPPMAVTPALTLVDHEITTALEPYAPTANIAPTRSLRANLTWRAEAPLQDFLVRLLLYDPDRRLVSQKDEAPVRGLYPPSNWEKGEYVSDVKNFLIPAGTPPGNYSLSMTVLDAADKHPATDEIAIGTFAVDSATNVPRDQVFVQHPIDVALDRAIGVAGYGGLDGSRHPGESLSFYLLWSVRDKLSSASQLRIALSDASGRAVSTWTRPPIQFYPTERWQPGEWLKAYYDIEMPKDLMPGDYDFAVGINQEPLANIARMHIAP